MKQYPALGLYKNKKDLNIRCGITAFTLREGAVVKVTQVDTTSKAVIIEFDSRTLDWYGINFLNSYFELINQEV